MYTYNYYTYIIIPIIGVIIPQDYDVFQQVDEQRASCDLRVISDPFEYS